MIGSSRWREDDIKPETQKSQAVPGLSQFDSGWGDKNVYKHCLILLIMTEQTEVLNEFKALEAGSSFISKNFRMLQEPNVLDDSR